MENNSVAMRKELLNVLRNASKDKPATRQYLRTVFRTSDRQIRKMISDLQNEGNRVVSNCTDGKGYWVARTTGEYTVYRNQELSRIMATRQKIDAMDRAIEGQTAIADLWR